jgi:murein DD-endopeptidase MepM/ murein hydrolase activator NlpD
LLDQEQFEQKLDELVRRQATLESRSSALSGMNDIPATGTVKTPAPAPATTGTAPPKPSPISDTVIFVPPPDQEARLESRALPKPADRFVTAKNSAGIELALARLQQSLDRVELHQEAALSALEIGYDTKARRIRGILSDLGLDLSRTPPAGAPAATGGPFVPVTPRADASAFERQLHRLNLARAQIDRLSRTLVGVPIRKPLTGELDTSSGFGVRMDPFLRSPAMHTGLDFRSSYGEPARATAAGKVVQAGWSGGYGKLVEIDHGNGLSTRYGHLSSIDVEEGQTVRIGQIVGRVGSTGRSTGPHLHYETRVDGEAVDPNRFLRAANRLAN